ncbi:HK97-gp10 family putative phage morphogenesis protein [Paenibacillus koleovorans]|uniref:HK97-gp10 family putative phage morphogenesis protein n=1 Tax=Paenibacillus koleovorans TaxID=121608 RepID=UPI000FD90327|nr:HK97-gp10 family putative phage morphogenesis protein [Paenibacillus koleovorans]
MADRKPFSFSLEGIEVMIGELDRFTEELDRRLRDTLTRLALKVIHDAKRLAPLDTGDLEAALVVGEIMQRYGVMYIDVGTSPEVDHYAIAQHEGFRVTKGGKLVQFKPGEKTISKGPYNGEMPGKKYLERALQMNEKLIMEELSKILEG